MKFWNLAKVLSLAAMPALAVTAAQAVVTIDVNDVGPNVVFSASGSLDLTGAVSSGGYANYGNGFISGGTNWWVGMGDGGAVDSYFLTAWDGAFGTDPTFYDTPSSIAGDRFFIWAELGGDPQLGVTQGYQSGSAISSTMTFNGSSIAAFGMKPGTYYYSLPSDRVVFNIGGTPVVPLPASGLLLVGGMLAFAAKRRRAA